MAARLPYFLLALLTVRWWWPLVVGLCRDAYAAAAWPATLPGQRRALGAALPGALPVALASRPARHEESRPLPRRVLAFRAAARSARERLRWEGGFGRRGL